MMKIPFVVQTSILLQLNQTISIADCNKIFLLNSCYSSYPKFYFAYFSQKSFRRTNFFQFFQWYSIVYSAKKQIFPNNFQQQKCTLTHTYSLRFPSKIQIFETKNQKKKIYKRKTTLEFNFQFKTYVRTISAKIAVQSIGILYSFSRAFDLKCDGKWRTTKHNRNHNKKP